MKCLLSWIVLLAAVAGLAGPSVLFVSPQGARGGWIDLTWLEELHEAGYEPDWLEDYANFNWERIRQYNVLFIYGCPPPEGEPGAWRNGPDQQGYLELLDRFLEAGGGVFCMIRNHNGDIVTRPMIEPWGARLPLELYEESDTTRIRSMPHMRGHEACSLFDNIAEHPVTAGVKTIWWPYGNHYNSSWTAPLALDEEWTALVTGGPSSRTVPFDPTKTAMPIQDDPLVRGAGVAEPAMLGVRDYQAGRILLMGQWPTWSVGQGTEWLYERRVLSRGFGDVPSHFGLLLRNAFTWLAEPSLDQGQLGGYTATPERFLPPNHRQEVLDHYKERFWNENHLKLGWYQRPGELYHGFIGAQTSIGSGQGSVADYAAAAREAGLDYVIFLEDFASLTPEKLEQLRQECANQSGEDLLLIPGYRIATNTQNHMLFYGLTLHWPEPDHLTGPNNQTLNLQYQDETGEYQLRPVVLDWLLAKWHGRDNNAGYYDFTEPGGQRLTECRLFSVAAIMFYRDGELVEDLTEDYLVTCEGTLGPGPIVVDLVAGPGAMREAVAAGHPLTWVRARGLGNILEDALRWTHQYDGVDLWISSGPVVEAWPYCWRVHTYGGERFTPGMDLMLSGLRVRSDAGLKELRIYNGRHLVRRFLPGGAAEFDAVLHLPGVVQQNLVLIAEDVEGGRAVTFSRRCWKDGSMGFSFCSDHVNDCGLCRLARGPGCFTSWGSPLIEGGYTWDGGPKGLRWLFPPSWNSIHVVSDKGSEDGAGGQTRPLVNIPTCEFTDDQALVVRSELDRVYAPDVPAVNPWHSYGPTEETKLITATRRYMEWNRPIKAAPEIGWAAVPERQGASLGSYSCTVTFKQDQTLESLRFLSTQWTRFGPAILMIGEGLDGRAINLAVGRGGIDARIDTGAWFAVWSPETCNPMLVINRGAPFRLRLNGRGPGNKIMYLEGDVKGQQVTAGEQIHYEIFTVVDPVDQVPRGVARFSRVLDYLERPTGLKLVRGKRVATPGIFEVQAAQRVVELDVPAPPEPIGLTVPVRISGLNPKWSAGYYQVEGWAKGHYSNGKDGYSALGFDWDGRVYTSIFPDTADRTHVLVGHPVVCDNDGLIIEVMPRPADPETDARYAWHVAINNPTDAPITATFRQGLPVRDLEFPEQTHEIPAGGHVILLE